MCSRSCEQGAAALCVGRLRHGSGAVAFMWRGGCCCSCRPPFLYTHTYTLVAPLVIAGSQGLIVPAGALVLLSRPLSLDPVSLMPCSLCLLAVQYWTQQHTPSPLCGGPATVFVHYDPVQLHPPRAGFCRVL